MRNFLVCVAAAWLAVFPGATLFGQEAVGTGKSILVRGTVLLPDGQPAADAEAALTIAALDGQTVQVRRQGETKSAADGSFSLELAGLTGREAFVMVQVRKAPHAMCWRSFPAAQPPQGEAVLSFKLGTPAVFAGTVVDGKGGPVAGATINVVGLVWKDGAESQFLMPGSEVGAVTSTSNAQGEFLFGELPQGARVILNATADGLGEAWLPPPASMRGEDSLPAVGGEPVRIELGPEAKVSGTVRQGADGPGIANADVMLAAGSQLPGVRTVKTGPDGRFAFGGMAGGVPYMLTGTVPEGAPAGVAAPVRLQLGAGEAREGVDIVFDTPGEAVLRILTTAGAPIAGARVFLTGSAGARGGGRSEVADAKGEVHLLVPAGTWTVNHIQFQGGYHAGQDSFTIEAGKTVTKEIRIPGFRGCGGVVRDAAGGPVAGVEVTVHVQGPTPPPVKTDADGGFTCSWYEQEYQRGGQALLLARLPDRGWVALATVPSKEQKVEMVLGPGSTLTGTIAGEPGKPVPK